MSHTNSTPFPDGECDHPIDTDSACEKHTDSQQERLKKRVKELYPLPDRSQARSFHDLPVHTRILLGTLLKYAVDKGITHIRPFTDVFRFGSDGFQYCYPNSRKTNETYFYKFDHTIVISPLSDINVFSIPEDNPDAMEYHPYRAEYIPLIKEFFDKDLDSIWSQPFFSKDECKEVLSFWEDLVADKYMDCLRCQFIGTLLYFYPGKKTRKFFKWILKNHSQFKVNEAIYRFLSLTTDRYASWERLSLYHSAGLSIKDQFREANQTSCPLNEDCHKLKKSAVSAFFFQYVIPIQENEFTTVPSMKIVESYIQKR